jgi:hypothetical protein
VSAESKETEIVKSKATLFLLNSVVDWPVKNLSTHVPTIIESALRMITAAQKGPVQPIPGDNELLKHAFALMRATGRALQQKKAPIAKYVPTIIETCIEFLALPDAKTMESFEETPTVRVVPAFGCHRYHSRPI